MRERILQSADELFSREGVHTVGIARVLEHAGGVAKASLYSNFESKDELVLAYLGRRSSWLRDRIESRMATLDDPAQRILAVFDELADRVADAPYYGCLFVRACAEVIAEPGVVGEAAAAHRRWQRGVFVRLAREARMRDPEALGLQLAVLYDGAMVVVSMDRDPSAALAARNVAARLLAEDALPVRTKKSRRT